MFDAVLRVIENVIIAVTFAFITLLAFANVIARYVFSSSFSFTSELLVNLAVLLTLVGASAATRNGSHPAFSMIRDATTGVVRKIVVTLVCLAMIAFFAVFCWLGYDMVVDQASSGRLTPALGVPQWIFSLALPFGALLGATRTVQILVAELRGRAGFQSEETDAIEQAQEDAAMVAAIEEGRKP